MLVLDFRYMGRHTILLKINNIVFFAIYQIMEYNNVEDLFYKPGK